MTIQELRQLPAKDLRDELERISREYLKKKMDVEGGFAKETHRAKQLRRQIARIRTIETEIRKEESLKPKTEKKEEAKSEEPKKVAKKTKAKASKEEAKK